MPSFTTVLRAIVMLVAAVLLVKGWQSYGPSTEQLKAIALRALETTSANSKKSEKPANQTAGLVAEENTGAPLAPPLGEATLSGTQTAGPTSNVHSMWDGSVKPAAFADAGGTKNASRGPAGRQSFNGLDGEHLSALLKQLETLGGTEPKLTAWGTTGELYRFSCRAAIADIPAFARHFESVAATPQGAVEDVVAKVGAWRTAQREQHRVQ
jgi:hypothetical protein